MSEIRGNVLPVYIVADESASMASVVDELNTGLAALYDALLKEPMAAAKVRFTILGFSQDVIIHVALADLAAYSLIFGRTTRATGCCA